MVHNKSEYRRTFRWKSEEECQAIWKENWKIRNQLKIQEYQHVPFAWENNGDGSDDDESVNHLPPSKLHLKYLELTKTEEIGTSKKTVHSERRDTSEKSFSDKEVQTPPWKGRLEYDDDYRVSPEKEVQTDITIPPVSNICRNLEDDFKSVYSEPVEITRAGRKREHIMHTTPRTKPQVQRRRSPASTSRHALTQTEGKKMPKVHAARIHRSPFVPYGWADETREMAGKQTFNIKASRNIYPSALHAMHQRQIASATKIKEATYDVLPTCEYESAPHNCWMSEYKSSYCRSKTKDPADKHTQPKLVY